MVSHIVQVWASWVLSRKTSQLSPDFDGLFVNGHRVSMSHDFKAHTEAQIRERTGYDVVFVGKEHFTFVEDIMSLGCVVAEMPMPSEHMTRFFEHGNAVATAVGHSTGRFADVLTKLMTTNAKEAELRTYESWKSFATGTSGVLPVALTPTYGVELPSIGAVIVHVDGKERPHCVVVRAASETDVLVFDGPVALRVKVADVVHAAVEAADHSTLVKWESGGDGGLHGGLLALTTRHTSK